MIEGKEALLDSKFLEQLDAYLNGTFPKRDMLFVSDTPKVLQSLGFDHLPMMITRKHLYTIMRKSGKYKNVHYHDLGLERIKKLPFLLEDPQYVFQSSTRSDSIVIVTKMRDNKDRIIIISIKKNGSGNLKGKIVNCHVVTSVYGRNNDYQYIKNNIQSENLIYYKNNKK